MAHVNATMTAYAATADQAPKLWTRNELVRTIVACVITNAALIALWLR